MRFSVGILGLSLLYHPAFAATTSSTPDWACVQAYVPEISVAQVWTGPPIDDTFNWRELETLATTVDILASRRTSEERFVEIIEEFSSSLEKSEKNKLLTALFAGFLEKSNAERRQILDGIQRYVRKQKAISDQILKMRKEFKEVLSIENKTEQDKARRDEIESNLNWQTRIHEEREKSLVLICEIPVYLDQRVFSIAREISYHLED